MALKEKIKNVWKRMSDLDDETESAKRQATGEDRIPYKEISKKLKEIMKQNVDVVGRKILIPTYYAIYFNEADRNLRIEVEDVLCDELKEELFHEMRKINPEQNRRETVIEIKTDPSVEKGAFKIVHKMKKPAKEEENKIVSEAAPELHPATHEEDDFKKTVVEMPSPPISDDEQVTIIQTPESSVLYTLLVDSGEEKQEITVTKQVISIGRSSEDDVVLKSPDFSISRAHATIEMREADFYLMPSGINGTLLNGEELELKKEVKISPDDEVKIMDYTLRIQV
ncbi:MAG: FHA domain-containing protein [bacterium]